MKTKLSIIMGVAIALASSLALAEKADDATMKRASRAAIEICSTCHGPGGHNDNPTFPRLAGQQAEYIEMQLKAFKEHHRAEQDAHDFMWGIAALLDDPLISGLAYYYQAQTPSAGEAGNATIVAKGDDIFHNGVPSRGVLACANCHGPKAAGVGAFPRLAGQHREYLLKQLQLIQNASRSAPVMHGVIKDLKPEEMEALAAYLHSM